MNHICKICKKTNSFEKINSYKHYWYYCLSCKNIFSQKKNKVFFENIFLKSLIIFISKITNLKRLKKLLLINKISGSEFYDYELALNNKAYNKWDNYDDKFLDYLKKNNIDLKNKNIVSFSDEPGFIGNKLKKYTNKILFTALSENTVKLMNDKIGIKTVKYDFNEDYIYNITNQKYDIIIYRSCLNFAFNFEKILEEISSISNPNSTVILEIHSPTISSCLMWMFDDYTLLTLINGNYLKKFFKKKNFICKKEDIIYFNPRKHYYNSILKKIFYYPFYFFYSIKFKIDKKKYNYTIEFDNLEIAHKFIFTKL